MVINIAFGDGLPGELTLQKPPSAHAEGESVVLILPVFVADAPAHTADVRVTLEAADAEQLYLQIRTAWDEASGKLREARQ